MSSYIYEVIRTEPEIPVKCFGYQDTIGYTVAAHWHNSLELIRINEGAMTVSVGEVKLVVEAGSCIVINSREIHATFCRKNTVVEVLQIPFPFLKRYIPDIDNIQFDQPWDRGEAAMEPGKAVAESETAAAKREQSAAERVGSLLHELYLAYQEKQGDWQLRFHTGLFELLHILYTNFGRPAKENALSMNDTYRQRLTRVMDYVNIHYRERITLERAASLVSLNKEYFCRFFHKYMGMSLIEYVNEVRFTHVCESLFSGQENVTEALLEHGFTNYKLFMKMFRERYHSTPGKKRREDAQMGIK